MLLSWNRKALFSRFTESCRALLLLTLPGAMAASRAPPVDLRLGAVASPDPLSGVSVLSATQEPALSTCVNENTHTMVPLVVGPSGKRKKGRKKVRHEISDISLILLFVLVLTLA